MTIKHALLLISLLACLLCASAANRLSDFANSAHDLIKAVGNAGNEQIILPQESNGKAYPLIEFKVPPQHSDEFVKLFRKVHEIVQEQEPEVKYSLSRQSDGNLIWYIYGEFASVEDYNKHASQQYEHDFYNGINELGIVWESHLLQPVLG